MNKPIKSTFYLAYNLTDSSREQLLNRFPPQFARVIAHHATYEFGVTSDTVLPPIPTTARVVGYSSDGAIEALVVEIDGSTQRPDGSTYHITLSLDPDKRKPVDSNRLLEAGWQSCEPYSIQVLPALNG